MEEGLKNKLYRNSIILEKITKLNSKEKQKAIIQLLKGKSERELGEELGLSHSVIHDWKTGRQNNNGNEIHISIDKIIEKLDGYKPKLDEYPKLEKLKKIIEQILERV